MVEFVIDMLAHNLIPEEFRRPCSRMRQERFCLGEFQLERFAQELSEFAFDFLGLFLWATETKSGSQGTLLPLGPLRTGLVPLRTSGSSTSRTPRLLVLFLP